MPYKNVTIENIHKGFSVLKEDGKWSDMLNFRSNRNSTEAIPRKFVIGSFDAGFHTILNGVGNLNYAVGSKKSVVFVGHDKTLFSPLWRLDIKNGQTQQATEGLRIRGFYTGGRAQRILVTFVKNRLVTKVISTAPEEPADPVVSDDLGFALVVKVKDFELDKFLPGEMVLVYDGVELVANGYTNGNGAVSFSLSAGNYRVVVEPYEAQYSRVETLVALDENKTIEVIVNPRTRIIADRGLWTPPYYEYDGYMVLQLWNPSFPSVSPIILHTFTVREGAPQFDFAPFYWYEGELSSDYTHWKLYETTGGVIYFNNAIGT